MEQNTQTRKQRTPCPRLLLMAVATGLGGSFQYGLNLSLINVPTKVVQGFINSTWESRYGHPVSSSVLTLIWSIIASVFAVGGLAGAILAGPMAQQLGRKCGLLANNAFAILASVLMGVSDVSSSFELLIIGRFLIGVNCGVGLSLQPMYLSECAPQHQRGALAMSTSIFLTLGIFCGQIVGLREVLGGQQQLWAVVLALPVLPALTQLLVLPFFPESPCYLLIDRGQPQQARQDLLLFHVRVQGGKDPRGEDPLRDTGDWSCRNYHRHVLRHAGGWPGQETSAAVWLCSHVALLCSHHRVSGTSGALYLDALPQRGSHLCLHPQLRHRPRRDHGDLASRALHARLALGRVRHQRQRQLVQFLPHWPPLPFSCGGHGALLLRVLHGGLRHGIYYCVHPPPRDKGPVLRRDLASLPLKKLRPRAAPLLLLCHVPERGCAAYTK
ncbi:solute carrier family 2, facilitated glucose transporter member 11-like isoform X3 [Petromyzon marinus]|uniref:solute carrier family 2, facilitated glucose transporter member 11-like isoform X3 n=1 Tax=Petromyzon marinus TaxID=7757 RepID=UPI003F6E52F6